MNEIIQEEPSIKGKVIERMESSFVMEDENGNSMSFQRKWSTVTAMVPWSMETLLLSIMMVHCWKAGRYRCIMYML